MANVNDILAGHVFVVLGLNDKGFVSGLKKAQDKLKAFSNSILEIGTVVGALSAAMAVPLLKGVTSFASFGKQMARVSTMLNQPAKFMDKFSDGVQQMSMAMGEGVESLSTGLYQVLSATIPASDAMYVLDQSARAAKAGISDTSTAVMAITNLLFAYGMEASRAGELSDWFFQVLKRGVTTFELLARNVGKVSSVANIAGVSLDELGAGIATLTRVGVRTEYAMTGLMSLFASFIKPAKMGISVAKKYGLELNAATLRTIGLTGAIKKLKDANIEDLGKMFPNVRAIRAIVPLIQNIEGFNLDLSILKDKAGSAEEAFQKMTKNTQFAIDKLKQTWEYLIRTIGEALEDPTYEAIDAIKGVLDIISKLIRENKALVGTFANVAIAVTAIAGAFIALGLSIKAAGLALRVVLLPMMAIKVAFIAIGVTLLSIFNPILPLIASAIILFSLFSGALKTLGNVCSMLKSTYEKAIGGILASLQNGEIESALEIMWKGIEVAWEAGKEELLRNEFVSGLLEGLYKFRIEFEKICLDLQTYWANFVHFVKKTKEILFSVTNAITSPEIGLGAGNVQGIGLKTNKLLSETKTADDEYIRVLSRISDEREELLRREKANSPETVKRAEALRISKTQEQIAELKGKLLEEEYNQKEETDTAKKELNEAMEAFIFKKKYISSSGGLTMNPNFTKTDESRLRKVTSEDIAKVIKQKNQSYERRKQTLEAQISLKESLIMTPADVAKKELEQMVSFAKEKRAMEKKTRSSFRDETASYNPRLYPFGPLLKKKVEDTKETAAKAIASMTKSPTIGGFQAFRIQGIQAFGGEKSIETSSAKTADNTTELVEEVKNANVKLDKISAGMFQFD